ncbi:MAG: MarR family winged helix-turn-helix transcriptional regulator [Mycobacteriaceae bacterium]
MLAAQREGNRMLTEQLRSLHVTPSQAEGLRVLADRGSLSLKQVGELLVCETGSPSRLLATLVDAGFVERRPDPADGRAVLLQLTDDGAALADQVREVERRLYDDIDSNLHGLPLEETLELLTALVHDRPAGLAYQRRST